MWVAIAVGRPIMIKSHKKFLVIQSYIKILWDVKRHIFRTPLSRLCVVLLDTLPPPYSHTLSGIIAPWIIPTRAYRLCPPANYLVVRRQFWRVTICPPTSAVHNCPSLYAESPLTLGQHMDVTHVRDLCCSIQSLIGSIIRNIPYEWRDFVKSEHSTMLITSLSKPWAKYTTHIVNWSYEWFENWDSESADHPIGLSFTLGRWRIAYAQQTGEINFTDPQ